MTVTYLLLGVTTSATTPAVTVIPQASGPTGRPGPTGATGPGGPVGQVELVLCTSPKRTHGHRHRTPKLTCRIKTVSGPVKFRVARADQRAVLSRGRVVYATGYVRGSSQTWLLAARRLAPGQYTLTLSGEEPRRTTTRRGVKIT